MTIRTVHPSVDSGKDSLTAAVLLCGGSGTRMRGIVDDKVLAPLGGHPVWWHSLEAFMEAGVADIYMFVCRDADQRAAIESALPPGVFHRTLFAPGGDRRQDSVWNALEALPPHVDHVMIHDCARPLVTPGALVRLDAAMRTCGAATLAHPVVDTLYQVPMGMVEDQAVEPVIVDRSRLWGMETPQAFDCARLRACHAKARDAGVELTDDIGAMRLDGCSVLFVSNPDPNPKLTVPDDFTLAEFLLSRRF